MSLSTANVIEKLFEHCEETLPIDALQWLGGLDSTATIEADNIAETLHGLASVLSSDNKSALPGDDSLALILCGLASRLETVSTLISVSGEAAYLATKRIAAAKAADKGGQHE